MKRFKSVLKWIGTALLVVVSGFAIFYGYARFRVQQRIDQPYYFPPEALEIVYDSVTIAKGAHLADIKGCHDCHGKTLAGKAFVNDFALGTIYASNLTAGKGGLPSNYATGDWIKALRHGVGKNGKPLLFMPSHETAQLSREDLRALIAYCRKKEPADNVLGKNKIGPVATLMTHFDKLPLLSVEMIDHQQKAPDRVDNSIGAARGKYLAVSCVGCHRPNMKGGPPPAPGMLPVPDITTTGAVGLWDFAQFRSVLKTGKRPDGRQIKAKDMPWTMTAEYTEDEIKSLYLYLNSL